MGENICTSGGAIGSDLFWGDLALTLGHSLYHISFKGHKIDLKNSKAKSSNISILGQKLLNLSDEKIHMANLKLNRTFPTKSEKVNNLLRRNWYQIRKVESVYAIAPLEGQFVGGGTGWAVQMYLDRDIEDKRCYVFNIIDKKWYLLNNIEIKSIEKPPLPSGRWAGIGTRALSDDIKAQVLNSFEGLEK